jgi:hypothetical protein
MPASKPDPLYLIFEKHLNESQEKRLDKPAFIQRVLQDYLSNLKSHSIGLPAKLEPFVYEALTQQVHLMLIKKTYGFLSTHEYHQAKKEERNKKKPL